VTETAPVRVWLSLGSNISPQKQIVSAIATLKERFGELIISPVYESKAVGFEGDNFLNLVVGIVTDLLPQELNAVLRKIEEDQGRLRSAEKFSPRTLDIDLLTYGEQVISQDNLQIPRDEILRYAFVLRPLADVAANECHPQTGRTYGDLWQDFDGSDQPLWPVALGVN
jgi:2-amino-4-hydroxy-6-hydroxymethyldihydropteridine diphosphokinase